MNADDYRQKAREARARAATARDPVALRLLIALAERYERRAAALDAATVAVPKRSRVTVN